MDRWLMSFIVGALLSLFLPIVPSLFYVLLFTILSLLIGRFLTKTYISCAFLGAAWIIFHGVLYENIWQNNNLDKKAIHQDSYQVLGVVTSLPQSTSDMLRFNFRITQLANRQLIRPMNVRMSWKKPPVKIKQGQQWQLLVKLKPAHGLANEGGFHYQTWLRHQNIHATGYVKKVIELVEDNRSFRQQLFDHYQTLTDQHQQNALLQALTFGIKQQITKAQWHILTATATQHLIAISGLHLGVVVVIGFYIGKAIRYVFATIVSYKIQHKNKALLATTHIVDALISIIFATFYAYLAGFSQPTIRALVMLVLLIMAKLIAIKLPLYRLLLMAVSVIVIFSPFSLISASFWLSLSAVSAIFLFLWRTQVPVKKQGVVARLGAKFTTLFTLQCFLILAILPLSAVMQWQISMISIPANLIAVPWISIVCVPLTLLSVIVSLLNDYLAGVLIKLSQLSLDLLWQWLSFCGQLPWASIPISFLHWTLMSVALVCLILVWLNLHKRWQGKAMVFACILIAFVGFSFRKNSTQWSIDVLDVGQGLSVVIRQGEETLVYDTGATFASGFSMTETVLIPFLRFHGIDSVNRLVISHDDNDHASGLALLTNAYSLQQVHFNQGKQYQPCVVGRDLSLGELHVDVLHPIEPKALHNDDSCVIKLSDGQFSVLLTGDISHKVEKVLIDKFGDHLKSTLLIAPHHGSKTSSSNAFIKAVSPEYVVFSAGYLNRWRMPHQRVVDRYQRANVTMLTTGIQGSITFTINNHHYVVQRYRQDKRHFWFAN